MEIFACIILHSSVSQFIFFLFYQVLHAGECGSRDIEAVKRIEGEAQPPQHQRVYGVAMPPPPSSSSSNKMDAISEMDTTPIAMEKEDASLPPSSSPPRRVYGVAMPPAIPKEQSIDAMEEEEGVVPVKSKKMYGPAMPPPSMQNTTGNMIKDLLRIHSLLSTISI